MASDFWDLTDKPQTKTKLQILKDYLNAWAIIFARQKWCDEMYYVDCCAGRGKYHNNGQKDIIDGSPLVALNIAKYVKDIYKKKMNCLFIESDQKVFNDLQKFAASFKDEKIQFECLLGDINNNIDEVLSKIPDKVPIFFFIDPSGIDIKRDTLEKMLNKNNIKEFLINYIQKGVERCQAFGEKCEDDTLPIKIHKMAISNLRRVQDFSELLTEPDSVVHIGVDHLISVI